MSSTAPFLALPTETLREIGDLLSVSDLSALSRASRTFHSVFTRPLFRRVRESLRTHLFRIMHSNNIRLLTYLLDEGLPVDCTMNTGTNPTPLVSTLLHFAAYSGSDALVRLLIDRGANISAATNVNPEGHVQRAITNDSEVLNAGKGWTPLHCAAINGHDVVARLLIENGAVVCAAAENGKTPLHCAAYEGHVAMCELLISKGANVSAVNKRGVTALFSAAMRGHEEVARMLIANGAEVSIADENGRTPLHYAAMFGWASVFRLFLLKGANVSALDVWGDTPIQMATRKMPAAVIELISE